MNFIADFSVDGLKLTEIRIPQYVVKDSATQLECLYDLDGEALYSVKWYKDGNEFYRYVPRDMPPAQTFLLPGVNVDVSASALYPYVLMSLCIRISARKEKFVGAGVALKLNIKNNVAYFCGACRNNNAVRQFPLWSYTEGKY